jgi:hypothetical protein
MTEDLAVLVVTGRPRKRLRITWLHSSKGCRKSHCWSMDDFGALVVDGLVYSVIEDSSSGSLKRSARSLQT